MIEYTATGYRLWVPRKGKILYGRNVTFNKNKNIRSWKGNIRDCDCVCEKDDVKFVELVNDEIVVGNEVYIGENSGENRSEYVEEPIVECSDVTDDDVSVDPSVNVEPERTRHVRERKVSKNIEDYVISSYMASVHVDVEYPSNFREAIASEQAEEWRAAMQREIILCRKMMCGNLLMKMKLKITNL